MKFFIDTANIDEIKKALALGMVDGVTHQPVSCGQRTPSFSGHPQRDLLPG